MQVILLEKVEKLGSIGSVVTVKNGFARNYLLPRKKAVRATTENLAIFEHKRAELERMNAEKRELAEQLKVKVDNLQITLVRQAGEDGRLFGSVSARDIVNAIKQKSGIEIQPEMVILNAKFKQLGMHSVELGLHPDVKASVNMNISRNEDEVIDPATLEG